MAPLLPPISRKDGNRVSSDVPLLRAFWGSAFGFALGVMAQPFVFVSIVYSVVTTVPFYLFLASGEH